MQASPARTPAFFKHRIVASLALLTLLSACGYKGPLYMPPPPPAPEESLTTPPQSITPTEVQAQPVKAD